MQSSDMCIWTVSASLREDVVTDMAGGIVWLARSYGSGIRKEAALAAAAAIEKRCYTATEAESRVAADTTSGNGPGSETDTDEESTTNYVRWASKKGCGHFIRQEQIDLDHGLSTAGYNIEAH